MKLFNVLFRLPVAWQVKIAKAYINREFSKKVELKVKGQEVLSDIHEPVIVICNHLSNLDGIVLAKVLKPLDITFVAGQKLAKDHFTNVFLHLVKTIPIKPNSADIESVKAMVNHIKGGHSLMIFPEGTRSRVGHLIPPKKGILLLARLTKAKILPLGIMGTEKVMPIKEEMGEERIGHGTIELNFGKPFTLPGKESGEEKKDYEERCLAYLMGRIAALIDEEYRGDVLPVIENDEEK